MHIHSYTLKNMTYRHALCADDDYDVVVVMLMVKFVYLLWSLMSCWSTTNGKGIVLDDGEHDGGGCRSMRQLPPLQLGNPL